MAQGLTKEDVHDVVSDALDVHTTKLFGYLGGEFSKIDQRFEETDRKIDKLLGAVSDLAANLKIYHEELLALGQKVDRLERWIHQIAQETGVKLSAE